MARPLSAESKKIKTRESLEKSLVEKDLTENFYKDKIDEYMSFYDDLTVINNQLINMKSNENLTLKSYTDATAEKRRISNEMRSILSFLGLKPLDGKSGGGYEEL